MVLGFEDGTKLTLPGGPSAHSFLRFDLAWLVYVHGKVTEFDPQNQESGFALRIPKELQRRDCFFC